MSKSLQLVGLFSSIFLASGCAKSHLGADQPPVDGAEAATLSPPTGSSGLGARPVFKLEFAGHSADDVLTVAQLLQSEGGILDANLERISPLTVETQAAEEPLVGSAQGLSTLVIGTENYLEHSAYSLSLGTTLSRRFGAETTLTHLGDGTIGAKFSVDSNPALTELVVCPKPDKNYATFTARFSEKVHLKDPGTFFDVVTFDRSSGSGTCEDLGAPESGERVSDGDSTSIWLLGCTETSGDGTWNVHEGIVGESGIELAPFSLSVSASAASPDCTVVHPGTGG